MLAPSRDAITYLLSDNTHCVAQATLPSCLINAQPLLAHRPAADNNSLIGCTSYELTDDWSLASTHFVGSQYAF